MSSNRLHRCCFTGHRPEKFPYSASYLHALLTQSILQSISDGFTTFISGMAQGTDIVAAEIVLELRQQNPNLKLICAVPYEGFEQSWSSEWQSRYRAILDAADLVRYISPSYSRSCFQIRNKWMVDRSARVIAVYNGTPGGTANTIRYAEGKGVQVINCLTLQ